VIDAATYLVAFVLVGAFVPGGTACGEPEAGQFPHGFASSSATRCSASGASAFYGRRRLDGVLRRGSVLVVPSTGRIRGSPVISPPSASAAVIVKTWSRYRLQDRTDGLTLVARSLYGQACLCGSLVFDVPAVAIIGRLRLRPLQRPRQFRRSTRC